MTTMSDVATATQAGRQSGPARRVLALVVGGGLAVAVVLLVAGSASANGHAQLHGGAATFLFVVAAALAWRAGSGWSSAAILALGVAAFAIPMVVEGVGALGYDAVTQERTGDLAGLHDIGLVATSLGMLTLVASIAAATGSLLVRRSSLPRPVAVAIAVAIGIVGALATRVLVGGM